MVITPSFVAKIGIGSVVFLMLGYFLWQMTPVFRTPEFTLLAPERDTTVTSPVFLLKGRMDGNSTLTVNTQDVYVDGEGNFAQQLYLVSGLNVVDITAKSSFGRKTTLTRYIVYKP